MAITYILIGIFLVGGLAFYWMSGKNKSAKNAGSTEAPQQNVFDKLRSMALSTTPEKLGLALPNDKTLVYGVIMDWEVGNGVATTVSYQTGDASVYWSSGGAVIGGGKHESVRATAKQWVSLAQAFLDQATPMPTQMPALPASGQVKFYLLTNAGIHVGQEDMKNFENHTSPWLGLFDAGNRVLTALRVVSESRS